LLLLYTIVVEYIYNLKNMKTLDTPLIEKRSINFLFLKNNVTKTKKVWDVLKSLWLNKIWTWKDNLSLEHDNILYK